MTWNQVKKNSTKTTTPLLSHRKKNMVLLEIYSRIYKNKQRRRWRCLWLLSVTPLIWNSKPTHTTPWATGFCWKVAEPQPLGNPLVGVIGGFWDFSWAPEAYSQCKAPGPTPHVLVYDGPWQFATFWELCHLLSLRCMWKTREWLFQLDDAELLHGQWWKMIELLQTYSF